MATDLISSADAASILGMSRPYTRMLCDLGRLGPVTRDIDGLVRVERDVVLAYREEQVAAYGNAPSFRQAGIDAGFYEHDDGYYTNVVRLEQEHIRQASTGEKDDGTPPSGP